MTLSIMDLIVTFSMKEIQHNDTQHNGLYRHTQQNGTLLNDTQHKRLDEDIQHNTELNDT